MSVCIKEGLPQPQDWMALRDSVGWATFSLDIAKKSLAATLYCVCAWDGATLVGMGRVLGDGVISFYIGNVMVHPQRQNEGIGKAIMEQIMAYVEQCAAPGAIASLLSITGKEEFYTKFGFTCRPDPQHGSGMSRYF